MRRPVTALAVLFAAAVWISVMISPPEYAVNPKADGRYVTLTGTVDFKEYAISSQKEGTYLKITLSDVSIENGIPEEASFAVYRDDKVLCEIQDEKEKQAQWGGEGAVIRVRGKVRIYRSPTNDGEFNEYLHYNSVRGFLFTLEDAHIISYTENGSRLKTFLFSVRNYLSGTLDALYAGRHGENGYKCASALKAMLLGQTSLMDRGLKEQFQAAGIIHVVCISGLHISMIGMGIFNILRKAGAPIAASSSVSFVFILLYGALTGMQTSCLRALVMFGFHMAAKALGRTFDMITALSVAAVLLLIEQPCYLYHSGFLFSFTAVAAAGLVSPAVPRYIRPFVIPLFTLPVQLSFYYTFPLYSVLLNLIVLTLAPFILAGGGAGIALYAVSVKILSGSPLTQALVGCMASAVSEVPYVILTVFEYACSVISKLPFSVIIAGRPQTAQIVFYYIMLALAVMIPEIAKCRGPKICLIQTAAVCAALLTVFCLRYKPPMSFYMLDVGQGDGMCVQIHDKEGDLNVLIDGGSSSKKNLGKYTGIPFLKYHGISGIDYCIITHDDQDHCSAVLELLAQADESGGIRIENIALPSVAQECKGDTYKKIESMAAGKNIPVTYLHRGMKLQRGDLNLHCIHPAPECRYGDANEYSSVLLMTYGKFSMLLTGDLEGQGEADLLKYLGGTHLNTNVLKAAHHGSGGGTTAEFLRRVSSHTALISCGRDNSYGHPAPETVQRLLDAGMRIYDTRINGQISITTDGKGKYSVHTFVDKSE